MPQLRFALAFLCLTVLAVAGRSDEKEGKPPTFASPQEAFDAASAAAKKEDWATFAYCLTDTSRDRFIGVLVLYAADGAFGKEKEKFKPIADVLAKYGITAEAAKNAFGKKDGLKKLVEPIKDKNAFFVEFMAAEKKVEPDEAKRATEILKGELKDVTIDGEKAKGKLTSKGPGGKTREEKIAFEKVGGGWKIVIID